jgi:hypothetical protein
MRRATCGATLVWLALAGPPLPSVEPPLPRAEPRPASVEPPALGAPSPEAPARRAMVALPEASEEALLDAWVRDGERGYFVGLVQVGATLPYSLYETRWWLELAPGRDARSVLAPRAVLTWIGPALAGELPASGLPPVAQVSYATWILARIGAPIDGDRVAATLSLLRMGGSYRASPSGAPEWGSTYLAVSSLHHAGLTVPAEVIEQTVASIERSSSPPDDALGEWIALLQVGAELVGKPSVPAMLGPVVREQLLAARSRMTMLAPDAAWLAYRAAIGASLERLGHADEPLDPEICGRLLDERGGVSLPGTRHSDPQATLYGLQLGCVEPGRVPTAPHSRAGWPTQHAIAASEATSAAAMERAESLGIAPMLTPTLERQRDPIWRSRLAWRSTSW